MGGEQITACVTGPPDKVLVSIIIINFAKTYRSACNVAMKSESSESKISYDKIRILQRE